MGGSVDMSGETADNMDRPNVWNKGIALIQQRYPMKNLIINAIQVIDNE